MEQVSETEIKNRLKFDNPWWEKGQSYHCGYPDRRSYFSPFFDRVTQTIANRAVVLMGPRRVGKTVMIRQAIEALVKDSVSPNRVMYASYQSALLLGKRLDEIVALFAGDPIDLRRKSEEYDGTGPAYYIFIDEVQVAEDWETQLKVLVDDFPRIRFVVSGSAAAALKMKSRESGAGRFSDFLLPPLTFGEYLNFHPDVHFEELFCVNSYEDGNGKGLFLKYDSESDYQNKIAILNKHFVDFINYGGFPEVIFSQKTIDNFEGFIGEDVLDKVFSKDLPSVYGIRDILPLQRFLAMLAYNTGREVSVAELSVQSGIDRQMINKYFEFLEAAFLIRRVYKISEKATHFKKVHTFKVYLTNPSFRTAFFGPMKPEGNSAFGFLVETAIMNRILSNKEGQWVYYARWKSGEVDAVYLDPGTQKPDFSIEIKWSDSALKRSKTYNSLELFAKKHKLELSMLLSKSQKKTIKGKHHKILVLPAAEYAACFGLMDISVLSKLQNTPKSENQGELNL